MRKKLTILLLYLYEDSAETFFGAHESSEANEDVQPTTIKTSGWPHGTVSKNTDTIDKVPLNADYIFNYNP